MPGARSGHQWGRISGQWSPPPLSGHWQPQPPPSHSLLAPASLSPVSTAELWLVTRGAAIFMSQSASVGEKYSARNLSGSKILSRFRWYLDDAGSFVATLRVATGWSGMVQGRAVMRKLGPEPRNQGGEDDTQVSDWPGCHHLHIWLVVDTSIIITVEWQLSPPGQDQNKVLASGLYAAKIIAIPLTSFLQFSRAPIIWRCNIWIKLMLNDHHLHHLDTFNVK